MIGLEDDDVNCRNTNLSQDMIITVVIEAIANQPEKVFGAITGFKPIASALALQRSNNCRV